MLGRLFRAFVCDGEPVAPAPTGSASGPAPRRFLGGNPREWEHLLRHEGHTRAAARHAVHRIFGAEGAVVATDPDLRRLAAYYFKADPDA